LLEDGFSHVHNVEKSEITSPAIIVVGKVVNLRKKLQWYESKTSLNRRVIITSPEPGASKIASHLEKFGTKAINLPVIKIVPVKNFYRIDKARTSASVGGEGGVGLGLSICKEIVDAHEGRIEVRSEVGKGSTFKVYLPITNKTDELLGELGFG